MKGNGKKVVVAMSGGVDSSLAASLLLEEGYEVTGASLRLWEGRDRGPRICSDHRGAEEVAEYLGVPHVVLDVRLDFRETVVLPFARSYLRGDTPNPCVSCNRDFKLGALLSWAREQGADYVATGHYTRIRRNPRNRRFSLFRGSDRKKDQSYFLFALDQEQLSCALLPLGEWTKEEVRSEARRRGLPAADRPESQDICFGDYRALVESHSEVGSDLGGEIMDRSGKVLGTHRGVHRFTVGQRRGLGIPGPDPMYVLEIRADRKQVIVGEKKELRTRGLLARSVNWIEPFEGKRLTAKVQVRYRGQTVPCEVERLEDGACKVFFEEVFPPVTPGQAAVFYRREQVLGGGWIESAIR